MASIRNSPWAKFTMRSTPKMSVRPTLISAYTAPSMIPETTSWISVTSAAPDRRLALALIPGWQRHGDWLPRGERLRENLPRALVLPLPYADRGAQVLTGVFPVAIPIEIGELDAAAVDQRAVRQVERQCDIAKFGRFHRFCLRQDLGEQEPHCRERCGRMACGAAVLLLLVALVELVARGLGGGGQRLRIHPRREICDEYSIDGVAERILEFRRRIAGADAHHDRHVEVKLFRLALKQNRVV